MGKRKIALLGATGSIGKSTIKILKSFPEDFELVGLAANQSYNKLNAICADFKPKNIVLYNEEACSLFPKGDYQVNCGKEGLFKLVEDPSVDIVVMALLGPVGLEVMLKAINAKKTIALASKEILVMGGELIMKKAKEHAATILPLDSEHSAIFQCLEGENPDSIAHMILTASGGPFRGLSLHQLEKVSPEQALKHPTWNMGNKVTLDCATLANKGLELIEARWLFDIEPEKLKVLIHPQSIIHSMVEFKDGSIKAQLSETDMVHPIQYALHYPERKKTCSQLFNFDRICTLELYPPELIKLPCLRLAIECMKIGGCATTIFNAANDVAGEAFLDGKIAFLKIPEIIDNTLERVSNGDASDLKFIKIKDLEARTLANKLIHER